MDQFHTHQKLPESNTVESGYLESMLDNFASSYKLFWFKGIYTELRKGHVQMEYRRIVSRMISAAWFPVVFYNLSLGHNDKLADAVWYVQKNLQVPREIKEEELVDLICNHPDEKLQRMIKSFTNLVPYRLIRPFYQREIEYEKKLDRKFTDHKVNRVIEFYNTRDQDHALYRLNSQTNTLTISPKWYIYIEQNAAVIEGWMNYKLIKYIQERNPNVPAIPFKIFPPNASDRSLTKETKYWKRISEKMPLYDIYTNKPFTPENHNTYGDFSLDHFIPWSFVWHNEIWNLYPMFKNVNSGKNNKLPDKNRYMDLFCEYQYKSFLVAKNIKELHKITEQYLNIKKDIYNIEETDRGHDAFVSALKNTIEPLYQIANNQGYGIWWYN